MTPSEREMDLEVGEEEVEWQKYLEEHKHNNPNSARNNQNKPKGFSG